MSFDGLNIVTRLTGHIRFAWKKACGAPPLERAKVCPSDLLKNPIFSSRYGVYCLTMRRPRLNLEGPSEAQMDRLFRALHSYSGMPTAAVVALGMGLVIATGVIEWTTDLPLSNDLFFVLIVGGVTFHGSATAGVSLALLAALVRLVSTGAPAVGTPIAWPLAATEAVALLAILFGFVLLARALHQAIDALQRQALRDPLTGALNTRGFMEAAERERLRALRNGDPLTIAYIDVDGLKQLNDSTGHQAGDRLLVGLAAAVVAPIRAYDIFARLGGDEFVLVLPVADQRVAMGIVARIRDELAAQQPPLKVSVGVVTQHPPTRWIASCKLRTA